jgi:hypothetical protein
VGLQLTSPKGEGPGPDRTSSIQNWGCRIKAITMVLQIIEHGALPCSSTKKVYC